MIEDMLEFKLVVLKIDTELESEVFASSRLYPRLLRMPVKLLMNISSLRRLCSKGGHVAIELSMLYCQVFRDPLRRNCIIVDKRRFSVCDTTPVDEGSGNGPQAG